MVSSYYETFGVDIFIFGIFIKVILGSIGFTFFAFFGYGLCYLVFVSLVYNYGVKLALICFFFLDSKLCIFSSSIYYNKFCSTIFRNIRPILD